MDINFPHSGVSVMCLKSAASNIGRENICLGVAAEDGTAIATAKSPTGLSTRLVLGPTWVPAVHLVLPERGRQHALKSRAAWVTSLPTAAPQQRSALYSNNPTNLSSFHEVTTGRGLPMSTEARGNSHSAASAWGSPSTISKEKVSTAGQSSRSSSRVLSTMLLRPEVVHHLFSGIRRGQRMNHEKREPLRSTRF